MFRYSEHGLSIDNYLYLLNKSPQNVTQWYYVSTAHEGMHYLYTRSIDCVYSYKETWLFVVYTHTSIKECMVLHRTLLGIVVCQILIHFIISIFMSYSRLKVNRECCIYVFVVEVVLETIAIIIMHTIACSLEVIIF